MALPATASPSTFGLRAFFTRPFPDNFRRLIMRVRLLKLFALSLLILLLPHLILAQATNGSIRGAVSDPNGAMLPNATVIVKHLETNTERRVVTKDEGAFVVDNLQPGEYEVMVEAQGFQKQLKRVTVLTSNSVELDFSLTV